MTGNKGLEKRSWRNIDKEKFFGGAIVKIVVGLTLFVFLATFFGGHSFWLFPGLVVIFLGVIDILNKIYYLATDSYSKSLSTGQMVFFVGLAGYLSIIPHPVLALAQTIAILIMLAGIVLIVRALLSSSARAE